MRHPITGKCRGLPFNGSPSSKRSSRTSGTRTLYEGISMLGGVSSGGRALRSEGAPFWKNQISFASHVALCLERNSFFFYYAFATCNLGRRHGVGSRLSLGNLVRYSSLNLR